MVCPMTNVESLGPTAQSIPKVKNVEVPANRLFWVSDIAPLISDN